MQPVVSAEWLEGNRAAVVLADVRWYLDGRDGRAAYAAGHLPGAVFVDLERWLAAPAGTGGRHPLPAPEVFAEGMSLAGIGDGDRVVAYDDQGGVIAARLVWMLRVLGEPAALLDGGLNAGGVDLECGEVKPARARFSPRPWPPQELADAGAASDPANLVIDAREPARFRGELEPVDPRAGHIPGARSLPCRENLDRRGRLLPVALLRERFTAAGWNGTAPVVSYCGSGVTACHNLIVMEHAGLGRGRLYPGSWSQYSQDENLPVATGEA